MADNNRKSARRRLLKIIAGSGSAAVGAGLIQREWARPVVQAIVLPAHAQTSCGGGQSYFGSVILTNTSGGNALLDLVATPAYAQAAPTTATAEICVACNGDGTVNVTVVVEAHEFQEPCYLIIGFAGDNIPLGQYRDLTMLNNCEPSTVTVRVGSINGSAIGDMSVQLGSTAFAGGFNANAGTCVLPTLPGSCDVCPD